MRPATLLPALLVVAGLLLAGLPLILAEQAYFPSESVALTTQTERWQVYPAAAAGESILHATWVSRGPNWNGPTDLFYARSLDNGQTWQDRARLNDVPGKVSANYQQERASVVVEGQRVFVFWKDKRDEPLQIRLRVSNDSGANWEPESRLVRTLLEGQYEAFPLGVVDGLGQLHLLWQEASGHDGPRVIKVVTSTDFGATFSEPVTLNPFDTGNVNAPEGGYPCDCCEFGAVGDPQGGLHLIYRNISRYAENETWYNYIAYVPWDGSSTPDHSVRVSADWVTGGRICPADGPKVALGQGGVVVAWMDGRTGVEKAYLSLRKASQETFGPALRINPPSPPDQKEHHPQIAASTDGGLILAWWTQGPGEEEGDLYFAHTPLGGSQGPEPSLRVVAAPAPGPQQYPVLALGAEPVLIYQENSASSWELASLAFQLREPPASAITTRVSLPDPQTVQIRTQMDLNASEARKLRAELDTDDNGQVDLTEAEGLTGWLGLNPDTAANLEGLPPPVTSLQVQSQGLEGAVDLGPANVTVSLTLAGYGPAEGPLRLALEWLPPLRGAVEVTPPPGWSLTQCSLGMQEPYRFRLAGLNGTAWPGLEVTLRPPPGTLSRGDVAPPFSLTDTEGQPLSLSDYEGQILVLDLMATWCTTCAALANDTLIPLQTLIDSGQVANTTLLSVDVDRTETTQMLASLSERKGYTWRHAMDTQAAQVSEHYQGFPVPHVIVVAPNGTVALLHRGAGLELETLTRLIEDLNTPATPPSDNPPPLPPEDDDQPAADDSESDSSLPAPSLGLVVAALVVAVAWVRRRR